ncbi:hypothetical protein PPERSA_05303 [Pseudocohnilembus persalinus]|uniref:Palmitoyltransferase n=1 Tax=Pseudocohnilembus persalinus TaxID=266149 RepID=A0A0V0R612_PSEPJ|nr:hypothetical protein PPERSA_05303 [Pseudocohnilembus persalinus]|eukprot:KRX09911.1 hypothetical protein PPERSA_05303 [Pseudocohnilembus persalinus]
MILIDFALFLSFGFTALRNPGITCKREIDIEDYEQLDNRNKKQYCEICLVKKIRNREHCDDCNICIDGFDHHCPWTGKCIGTNNIIAFNIFIICVMAFFISSFILVVFSVSGQGFTNLRNNKHNNKNNIENNSTDISNNNINLDGEINQISKIGSN